MTSEPMGFFQSCLNYAWGLLILVATHICVKYEGSMINVQAWEVGNENRKYLSFKNIGDIDLTFHMHMYARSIYVEHMW